MGAAEETFKNQYNCVNFITNLPISKTMRDVDLQYPSDGRVTATGEFIAQGAEMETLIISKKRCNVDHADQPVSVVELLKRKEIFRNLKILDISIVEGCT
eukprot:TRINITY_DN2448_c0_g1_i1.p2 TRINITY_DN2448_c0_g1~~TRINITY_DN2448_c0_g1_i1.p2  ORF type:complete len:100 (-),score=6.13 TRINITY_DN2448_c0_g1_i1:1574-1873(-)